MATAIDTQARSLAHQLMPTGITRQWLARLLNGLRGPDAGTRPRGLHVSRRGWKRNSALLMSLYLRDRA